jgi:hypothetical protein
MEAGIRIQLSGTPRQTEKVCAFHSHEAGGL